MACSTRARTCLLTGPESFTTRDTVMAATPARYATSTIVGIESAPSRRLSSARRRVGVLRDNVTMLTLAWYRYHGNATMACGGLSSEFLPGRRGADPGSDRGPVAVTRWASGTSGTRSASPRGAMADPADTAKVMEVRVLSDVMRSRIIAKVGWPQPHRRSGAIAWEGSPGRASGAARDRAVRGRADARDAGRAVDVFHAGLSTAPPESTDA